MIGWRGVKQKGHPRDPLFFLSVAMTGDAFHIRLPGDQDESPYSVVLVTIDNSDCV